MIPRSQSMEPFIRQELANGIALARASFLTWIKDPAFHDLCLKRFVEGDEEHGRRREWLEWPESRTEAEMVQEAADLCDYPTMMLVARRFREAA